MLCSDFFPSLYHREPGNIQLHYDDRGYGITGGSEHYGVTKSLLPWCIRDVHSYPDKRRTLTYLSMESQRNKHRNGFILYL